MSDKENLLIETKEMLENADEKTLRMVHAMLSVNENITATDWWDEMMDEQKNELEISILQADKGQTHPHSEALNILNKWRQK